MPRPQVLITRAGFLLAVSRDARTPLDSEEYDLLEVQLQFKYRQAKVGRAAYETGTYRPSVEVPVRVFHYDADTGFLVCARGFVDRIQRTFADLGYRVLWKDKGPGPDSVVLQPDADVFDRLELRPKQPEGLLAIDDRLAAARGGVFKAVPGFGKSHSFMHMCQVYRHARFLIVVPGVDLVQKTVAFLKQTFASVGQVGAGVSFSEHQLTARIVVTTPQSLHHFAALEPRHEFDIVVFDEVHKAGAEDTSTRLVPLAHRSLMLGFSATPFDRLDGTNLRLEGLFGPIFFEYLWPEAIALGSVVPVEVVWHDVFLNHNPCAEIKDKISRKRWGVWRNKGRNQVIAGVARNEPEDDQTLILVETLEHAAHLKALLPEYTLVYGGADEDRARKLQSLRDCRDIELPKISRKQRRDYYVAFERGDLKKVIATDVWATGVSFDSLQDLIRADGRTGAIIDEQGPSRVSRIHSESGKACGRVHDFLDQFDPRTERDARSRRRAYLERTWTEVKPQAARALPRMQLS
jgi:hypothetical protein